MTTHGVSKIAEERKRQLEQEGYTRSGDIGREYSLLEAAALYTIEAERQVNGMSPSQPGVPPVADGTGFDTYWAESWPWRDEDWKPTGDPVRDLVKAGALIAAAIDALESSKSITTS